VFLESPASPQAARIAAIGVATVPPRMVRREIRVPGFSVTMMHLPIPYDRRHVDDGF